MKRSRFTETEIVSILKETDAGMQVKEVCRKHGISDATYYNWKSKYGGMEALEIMNFMKNNYRVLEMNRDRPPKSRPSQLCSFDPVTCTQNLVQIQG